MVSACAVTHATPASFIAHNSARYNYEAIAADFLKTDIDLFIGGGLDHFTKREDQRNLVDSLKAKGYQIALNLDDVKAFKGNKLAGLLYPKHPPYFSMGRGDMLHQSTLKAIEILNKNEEEINL